MFKVCEALYLMLHALASDREYRCRLVTRRDQYWGMIVRELGYYKVSFNHVLKQGGRSQLLIGK